MLLCLTPAPNPRTAQPFRKSRVFWMSSRESVLRRSISALRERYRGGKKWGRKRSLETQRPLRVQ